MAKAYQPKVEVTLLKVVQRDRNRTKSASGPQSIIDLTPMLGDGSIVKFSRGVNAPSGVFSIDFPDKAMPQSGDSLYSMIEPMDIIEIRMAREPGKYLTLPVVFRGFVSSAKRSERMNDDGTPQRRVIVSGRDWGGIFQAIQIFYAKNYAVGQIMLNTFPMFTSYGVSFEYLLASDFVSQVIDHVVTPWLADLWADSALENKLQLSVKATVGQGRVGPFGIQTYQGGIWGLLSRWTDLPWNELIFDDDDNGSYLIYRAKPYRLPSIHDHGELIMSDAVDPTKIQIDTSAVVSLDVERTIDRIFNFFDIQTPQSLLNNPALINTQSMQEGSVFVNDNQDTDPAIYGLRKLSETSQMTSTNNTRGIDDQHLVTKKQFADHHNAWLESRRNDLKTFYQNGSSLENGTITLMGDERIKPGVELEIKRGALRSDYYVNNMTQVYVVKGAYTTEVEFIRGTGFLDRINTPNYLNEFSRGAYGIL